MSTSFCALLTTRPTRSHLAAAAQVYIAVAFLSASGVVLLFEHLRDLMQRGGRVRILTGNDLPVTEPDALRPPRAMSGQFARGYQTVSR
jgi:HKD family nuclease